MTKQYIVSEEELLKFVDWMIGNGISRDEVVDNFFKSKSPTQPDKKNIDIVVEELKDILSCTNFFLKWE